MKVIITGASGFIGRNLILRVPKSWDVVALYHRSKDFPRFVKKHRLDHIRAKKCDLTQSAQVQRLAATLKGRIDLCLYLAANGDPVLSSQDPLMDFRKNTLGLVHFLNFIKVKKIVFFSSGAVYDKLKGMVSPFVKCDPVLPYAVSKLACEQYIKAFQDKGHVGQYVILRFFGAYGPYEPARKIYTRLVRAFSGEGKSGFVVRGDGKNLIDAMFVDDAVEGIMRVGTSRRADVTVDFCSGRPLTINDLVRRAGAVFKKDKVKILHKGKVAEYIRFRVSPRRMERLFGFRPRVTLSEGLLKLNEFLQRQKKGAR